MCSKRVCHPRLLAAAHLLLEMSRSESVAAAEVSDGMELEKELLDSLCKHVLGHLLVS